MMQQEYPWDVVYPAVDITERLENRFPRYLKPDIVSVRIVQPRDRVWLEITRETEIAGGRIDQCITRRDLGIILRDGRAYFNPDDSIFINANKFADELDALSIIMTTPLFIDAAIAEIDEQFSQDRKST